MTQQKQQSFFEKYRKWIIGAAGIYLIPTILIISAIIGGIIYSIVNNDTNFHPYKSYIMAGFNEGFSDGVKNYSSNNEGSARLRLHNTPWRIYKDQTNDLKEKVALEKEEYLALFPESERGIKLAEMRIQNIKLPLQLELDKRFTKGIDFYADYVKQRVKRESFKSDKEYKGALKNEAWKVGYEYGYYVGASDNTERSGLLSLKG